MSNQLTFIGTQLPDGRGKRGSLEPVRRELRANPGMWAEVTRGTSEDYRALANQALKIRTGQDDIESAVRTLPDGAVVVYARCRQS